MKAVKQNTGVEIVEPIVAVPSNKFCPYRDQAVDEILIRLKIEEQNKNQKDKKHEKK